MFEAVERSGGREVIVVVMGDYERGAIALRTPRVRIGAPRRHPEPRQSRPRIRLISDRKKKGSEGVGITEGGSESREGSELRRGGVK